MHYEEYGMENKKIIVMLHGAHFVHAFGKQYELASQYHLIVPHLMGFGDHTDQDFATEACISELVTFIQGLNQKVYLVGFSLGAQIGFKLVAEHEELFQSAILVSPWLIKEEPFLDRVMKMNLKQLKALQNKLNCNFTGLMNGLPKKQRQEFVMQMQKVTKETVHNMVYNGITIDSVSRFGTCTVPILALAGAKEQAEVTDGIKKMAELNVNCRYEIWDKAGHNIPPMFAKRFNQLIRDTFIAEE